MSIQRTRPHSVVVGGTRGGGLTWARLLALRGHLVTVVGRKAPTLRMLNIRFHRLDLASTRRIPAACRAISAHGRLDSLALFQRYRGRRDPWDGELGIGLTATHRLIEGFADRFEPEGSRSIVAVSSVASRLIAQENGPGYHVAKAGLVQLVRYHAAVLGTRGLRVNCVSPGTVMKDESEGFYRANKALRALYERTIPLGRMGRTQDVAGVVDFLCGPNAAFVTGQEIVVDGGLSLLWQETLARKLTPLRDLKVTR